VKYSFDTSSLVEPWRRTYPPDVFPSLWEQHLPALVGNGDLRSTEEVHIELQRQDDELLEWTTLHPGMFIEVDEAVQVSVAAILAEYPNLIDVNTGRSGADPFVIALAQTSGCAVVTEEKPRSLINPKIPDVCAALGVPCMNMLQVIRDEGWTYR
jgi:hypothetical protein